MVESRCSWCWPSSFSSTDGIGRWASVFCRLGRSVVRSVAVRPGLGTIGVQRGYLSVVEGASRLCWAARRLLKTAKPKSIGGRHDAVLGVGVLWRVVGVEVDLWLLV